MAPDLLNEELENEKMEYDLENEQDLQDNDLLDMKYDQETESEDETDETDPDSDNFPMKDAVKQYLAEIGSIPLLSAEEEIELAKKADRGKRARVSLNSGNKVTERTMRKYRQYIREGEEAKTKLQEANLRLVVSIAKRFVGLGLPLQDLIQEGNIGLMKAVDLFDYRRKNKFSTYATWWIRQGVTRAISDSGRTIRIPVHLIEQYNKFRRISKTLGHYLNRVPKPYDIAWEMNMPEQKVTELMKLGELPVSLHSPVGEEEDSVLQDFIPAEETNSPEYSIEQEAMKMAVIKVLENLTEREKNIIMYRFGMMTGTPMTLEEVGNIYHVTRERIRQIEVKAIRKLRHPKCKRMLSDFIET